MTEWRLSARNKQLTPEGDWRVWLILAGRGWGKTKTGAQDIAEYALTNEGVICGVVAPTAADVRDVCFDGPSGLRTAIPSECIEKYSRNDNKIHLWNGSRI
ncbi:hypothetical protein, partial [Oenococcus oeni]|uniref:hypothetical protein n=1 Tax=Oenococcus oeni TaxID=1247 RepID=UPI001C5B2C52